MDIQVFEFLASSDDYLHAFDEIAGQRYKVKSSYFTSQKYPCKTGNGWSKRVGLETSFELPRNGAPWTSYEEYDMRELFKNGVSIANIAKIHGRTQSSVSNRLIKLGMTIDFSFLK